MQLVMKDTNTDKWSTYEVILYDDYSPPHNDTFFWRVREVMQGRCVFA